MKKTVVLLLMAATVPMVQAGTHHVRCVGYWEPDVNFPGGSFTTDATIFQPATVQEVFGGKSVTCTTFPKSGWVADHWRLNNLTFGKNATGEPVDESLYCNQARTNLVWNNAGGGDRNVFLAVRFRWLKYNLSYDSNGGTSAGGSTDVVYTNRLTLASAPTRTGYAFQNWTNAFGVVFSAEASVTGESFGQLADVHVDGTQVRLFAAWLPTNYTVTLDPMEGHGGPESVTASYGQVLKTLAECPTRLGYAFKGYYSDKKGAGQQYYDADGRGSRVYDLTSDLTLYASWSPKSYYVNYYSDDGTGGKKYHVQELVFGTLGELFPASTFARRGYVLTAWEQRLPVERKFDPSESVVDLSTDGEDVDLHAVWVANRYSVSFEANGGAGSMPTTNLDYGVEFVVPPCGYARKGCVFQDWSCDIDGQTTNFVVGAVVSNLTAEAGKNLVFRANWRGYYTVAFNASGASGTMTNETYEIGVTNRLPPNAFAKTGYAFQGWAETNDLRQVRYADGTNVFNLAEVGDTNELHAVWSANSYTVRFDANGASGTMDDQAFVYDQLQPLRANSFVRGDFWRFVGWTNVTARTFYKDRQEVINLTGAPDGQIVLKAVWETTLSDLSLAMGCDNLNWTTNQMPSEYSAITPKGWFAGTGIKGEVTVSCATNSGAERYEIMWARVTTNGVLQFNWALTGGKLSFYRYYPGGGQEYGEIGNGETPWTTTKMEISPEGVEEIFIALVHNGFGSSACITDMTWTPGGKKDPTPGDAVAPTAAGVSDGVFALTIPTTSGIEYGVWTNADLTVPAGDWGLMETKTAAGSSLDFSLPILPGVPQLFFRAFEVQ